MLSYRLILGLPTVTCQSNRELAAITSRTIVKEDVDSDGRTTILNIEVEKNIILKEGSEA